MKAKIFYKEESPYCPGKYMIRADFDKFYLKYTEGSYNVIQARLFGLSYSEFLRMCRDIYGAEITGKGFRYPVAYFNPSKKMEDLINELNVRANAILTMRV